MGEERGVLRQNCFLHKSPQVLLQALERLLTCRVLVPEQCSALCSPLRSSTVLMGRTLAPKRDRWSIRIVPLVPSWPGCLLADPYLPEHYLNGGF